MKTEMLHYLVLAFIRFVSDEVLVSSALFSAQNPFEHQAELCFYSLGRAGERGQGKLLIPARLPYLPELLKTLL